MVYDPKHKRQFISEQIRPELSYKIADFLKSSGGPYDMLPAIKWNSETEMAILTTWQDHLKSIDKPYVVTEAEGRLTLWKKL